MRYSMSVSRGLLPENHLCIFGVFLQYTFLYRLSQQLKGRMPCCFWCLKTCGFSFVSPCPSLRIWASGWKSLLVEPVVSPWAWTVPYDLGLVWTCMDLCYVWHAAWVKTLGQFKEDGNLLFPFCLFLTSGSQLLCFSAFPCFFASRRIKSVLGITREKVWGVASRAYQKEV